MKSAIAILTYKRPVAIQEMLKGLKQHCSQYPVAVFEDRGQDSTPAILREGCIKLKPRDDLMAEHWRNVNANLDVFLGTRNLGVAGNSNRALKIFMEGGYDHLLLCNDDLHILGDFVEFYAQAHIDLGIGCWCFNDFWESPTHRWIIARSRGYRVKVFPRMTGIMMSLARQVIEKVGYFDTRFPKIGQEHCDFTNRIRFAKEMQLDGLDQMCLDVEPTQSNGEAGPPVQKHQDIPSSVQGEERKREDAIAERCIQEAAMRYAVEHYYRPFSLVWPTRVGGVGDRGIKPEEIPGYKQVTSI